MLVRFFTSYLVVFALFDALAPSLPNEGGGGRGKERQRGMKIMPRFSCFKCASVASVVSLGWMRNGRKSPNGLSAS